EALKNVLIAIVGGHDEDAGLGVELEHALHHRHAVTLGHAQVQHHHIGPVLLVERDRLIASAGFRHYFHVGLLVDHGCQAVAHHRMIIGEHDADLGLHDSGH